jgi:hypothetical protein
MFYPDGSPSIKTKKAYVVYAVSLLTKTPCFARDEYEVVHLTYDTIQMKMVPIVMETEVKATFEGWFYKKPLKPIEPSLN